MATECEILCNMETVTAINNFEEMLDIPDIGVLDGIVIERVDLCFSLGRDERCINDEEINELVTEYHEGEEKRLESVPWAGACLGSFSAILFASSRRTT